MKPIPLAGAVLTLAAVATLGLCVHQRRALARPAGLSPADARAHAAVAVAAPAADPAGAKPLSEAEHLELLRLRGAVQPLLARQPELVALSNQAARLRADLAATRRSAAPLPPGYVRRADARNAGNATPAAAFETMLWAVEHRDVDAYLSILDAPMREGLRKVVEEQGAESVFKDNKVPGGRVVSLKETGPAAADLTIEFVPGTEMTLKFRRHGDAWILTGE